MISKNCTSCKELKPLPDFGRDRRKKDSRQSCCADCYKTIRGMHRHTRDGLISVIYLNQVHNSRHRRHDPPSYGKDELSTWIKSQRNFEALYLNWINSGYNKWKTPSVDRRDDYKPYAISNLLRVCTFRENSLRGNEDRKSGINNKLSRSVNQFTLDGGFIKEHYSLHSAGRKTNTNHGSISSCCIGKRKKAGGFMWRFA